MHSECKKKRNGTVRVYILAGQVAYAEDESLHTDRLFLCGYYNPVLNHKLFVANFRCHP